MGDDFRIYFVKPDKNGENNRTLVEAFEALNKVEYNFKPEWITSQECMKADGKGKQTYIFDLFKGEAFEHVKKCGYRIYGPRCILSNLQFGMDLPKSKKQPIYNLAMKDIKICCTSLDGKLRDEITEKVSLMAGKVDRNLTGDVTHLIAGEVGSNKYLVAVENGKPVMVKDWVFKVWELSQDRHVLATDEIFQKYTCPPFLGITVVVSGFRARERDQMKNFVVRGGGKYSGELKINECTHLIVKEPRGAKYDAAKTWRIKIITDRWLFDCMDKGKYLDPKPYLCEVSSQPQIVQTSTPERKSIVGPNISDISAITNTGLNSSAQNVDETTDMTSTRFSEQFSAVGRRCAIAETKIVNTFIEPDVTISTADVFLDGCRIYLSGIKPALQEKLRKIITSGCGLRSMEINDTTTHVVIGDIIASDILVLNSLAECPHVVTVDWLMECFHQHSHVSEQKYLHSDLGLKMPLKYRCNTKPVESSNLPNQVSIINDGLRSDTVVKDKSENHPESQAFGMDAPSDIEMIELLSQYMPPPVSEDPKSKSMTDNGAQLMDKGVSRDMQSITIIANDGEEEDSMTQDPNGTEEGADNGIFYKMKFIILDFDEEETQQLTMLIETKGGIILPCGKTRQVADIAIVPLMGFPVDVTVSEILTNAWLQMCVEGDELVPYNGWLSRPIELPQTEPLAGCCLCVSGYVGVERECIMHLAQTLGANCQDHFARTSRKNLQANTHLVVNHPSGSKYEAAKKWNIPAVGREWISACIKTGEHVPESEYLIEVLEEKRLQTMSTNFEHTKSANSSSSSLPTPPKAIEGCQANRTDSAFPERENTSGLTDDQHVEGGSLKVNTQDTEDNKQEKTKEMTTEEKCQDRVPTSSAESSDSISKKASNPNPMCEIQHQLASHSGSTGRTRNSHRKSACRPNQSENITAGCLKTPVDVHRQKWGLAHTDSPDSNTTPLGLNRGGRGGETPGTFMNPNFKPKFNLEGFFNTPDTAVDLNKSTPLGEVFRRQISKAAQNMTAHNGTATGLNDVEVTASQSQQDHLAPLHGVVIAVAKKLGHNHEQYNSVVVELGGNYSWHNGPHVTHFVFQGRPNDTNKEFRKARDERKIIVSPFWLFACKEQNCRVDEGQFPHNYNPNFSLTMTPASKITPSRSSRTMFKTKGQLEPNTKSAVVNVGKTPSKKMPVLNLQKSDGKVTESTASSVATHVEISSPAPRNDARQELSSQRRTRRTAKEDLQNAVNISADVESAGDLSNNEDCVADVSNEDNKSKNQDMKDALSKTLGLAEASRAKTATRKKSTGKKLSGQLNTSDGNTSQDSLPRTGAPGRADAKQCASHREPSQYEQVTWEDTTEILEKEKLVNQLKQAEEPSQNTDDLLAAIQIPGDTSNTPHETNITRSKSGVKSLRNYRSPTPEPPPLAFPIAKPSSKILSPQPIELLSEESSDSRMSTSHKSLPVFLISGLQNQQRIEYSALVEQLGGKLIEERHFDPLCTHLVVSQPTRNEKYLSCIASGKWVLHQSYFEACRKEGKFVEEGPHEWGSNFTLPLMQNMTPQVYKLAAAAYKWRRKITDITKFNTSCAGAYDGWKVLLCLDKTKEENFHRLLEAGGAKVSLIRSPFPANLQGTHAFVDLNKVNILQEDFEKLLEADIHCLKTEYIPAFLTDEPPPDPSEYYPAEFIALKASLSEPQPNRKRRRATDDCPSSNKSSRR